MASGILGFFRRALSPRSPSVGAGAGAGASLAQIERVEADMLRRPQVEVPVCHRFAPGVYLRSVVMPAGSNVIGHEHLTEHFNIVLRGRALVLCEGVVSEIVAPDVFVSGAGVRKVLHILEECEWATLHPTAETDPERLETELIRKSASFALHAAEVAALSAAKNHLTDEKI
jgi:quercetin dioxygenase-like cupin family protein